MTEAVILFLSIILLEVILSFDNAAVLAVMVKDLEPEQQKKALRYGIIGAYVFRGLSLFLLEYILSVWWLKPIGGVYLLWMASNHFLSIYKKNQLDTDNIRTNRVFQKVEKLFGMFWTTVIAVEFVDLVFSVDNVFAVVAYTNNFYLICAGVFIGIIAMRYVAQYFTVLINRYPFLEHLAFMVIAILGIKLCFSAFQAFYPEQGFEFINSEKFDIFISAVTLFIFLVTIFADRLKK
ncbi:MAG: DUF475 domain-containing protein [Cryomorphaceae bacterium]|nr:DUF475 domain-containing protein [Cryomorphaceae bacterium]